MVLKITYPWKVVKKDLAKYKSYKENLIMKMFFLFQGQQLHWFFQLQVLHFVSRLCSALQSVCGTHFTPVFHQLLERK